MILTDQSGSQRTNLEVGIFDHDEWGRIWQYKNLFEPSICIALLRRLLTLWPLFPAFQDRTVEPVESQFFEFYKPGNEYDILPLRESPIYTEDRVGLKTLDLAGKLDFLTIEGADHMQIPTQWFMDNVVAQYLQ